MAACSSHRHRRGFCRCIRGRKSLLHCISNPNFSGDQRLLEQLVEIAAFHKLFVLPAHQTPTYIFIPPVHCASCLWGKSCLHIPVKSCFTLCLNTFSEMRFKQLNMSAMIFPLFVQQPNNYPNCFNMTCTVLSIYLVGISFLFLLVSVACLLTNIWLCLMICTEDRAKWNISCLHQLQQLMHVNF